MRLHGRVVLLTGATGEIGEILALRLAGEGSSLVLCGRRIDALESLRAACLKLTERVLAIAFDVRDEAAMAEAFHQASSLGPIESAIACHGLNRVARIESMDLETWNEVVAANLTGCFLLVREAARRMRPEHGGQIVLVSSVAGRPEHVKFPGFGAYTASKYALAGLTEVLTAELAGSGVRVSLICPGGVDTTMFRRTVPGGVPALSREQVASAILDLADPVTAPPSGTVVDLP